MSLLIYLVSDIHGRADRLREILEKICFSDSDQLYILGDVIDRNPYGIQILKEIMSAENIHMLLGNHEYMMINAIEDPKFRIDGWFTNIDLWYLNGGAVTEASFKKLPDSEKRELLNHLKRLPINIEIVHEDRQYLLAHGSPESKYQNENSQYADKTEYAVWNRFDPQTDELDKNIQLICGHTPTVHLSGKLPMEVFRSGNVTFIDCGCAYPSSEGGRLACLCLDTGAICYSSL